MPVWTVCGSPSAFVQVTGAPRPAPVIVGGWKPKFLIVAWMSARRADGLSGDGQAQAGEEGEARGGEASPEAA